MSFGLLVKFNKNLKNQDLILLNKTFVQVEPKTLVVLLENMVKLRNHCAHINRLYNQNFDNMPLYGLYEEDIVKSSLFARLIALRDLLQADEY